MCASPVLLAYTHAQPWGDPAMPCLPPYAAESTQLGWVSRGDSFGEAALVNPAQQRPVSVVAGDEGAVLLVLDRASFNRLQQQAREGGVLAAAAVQAVLAAACRPILKVGGRARSAEEVETLAELFSGLEVSCGQLVVWTVLPACMQTSGPTVKESHERSCRPWK